MLLTPLAGWWLIGDQSFTGRPRDDLDYAFRAPEIAGWITAVAGAIALVIATAAVITVVLAVRRGLIDDRWLGVIGMLIGAGVVLAFIARTATAGVVGANIGAGLAIFFGGAIVAGLVVAAGLRSWWIVAQQAP